jgi:hypothetical protein
MQVSDIQEGVAYRGNYTGNYFRVVSMIMDAPKRPGGKLVVWSTEGFQVRNHECRTHGKCGIETFARWAHTRIKTTSE